MKFPFLKFFEKKAPTDYFLALLFRDEKIHAVVFEQINGRIQVVGEGKADLPSSLESVSDETLLDSCDKAISIAETSLPNGIQTHKTVFGVKETWVEDTHITKDHLTKLKTISDQLDLKPIGFLVFPEAIAHLLQKEEGAPVSAILAETGKKQLTITLLRAGRIVGTEEVPLGESLTATLEDGLKQFDNVEILPSRVILFDQGDTKAEKAFLAHKWSKSLPFLHVPQVTTLPADFDTRAILFGTATQMGLDAIDVIKQPIKKSEAFFEDQGMKEEEAPSVTTNEVEQSSHGDNDEITTSLAKDEPSRNDKQDDVVEEVTGDDTSEYFGFVKNADVALQTDHPHKTSLPHEGIEPVTNGIPEKEVESALAGEAPGFSTFGPIFVEGAKKIGNELKRFVPSSFIPMIGKLFSSLPKGGSFNKLFLVIPLALILLLGGFLWYIFGVKATVRLFLSSQTISQDQVISFTTTGSTDPSKNLVAAQTVSVNEEGKVSGNATGTKDVGTPAKGTVTIFNSDDSSHTLSSGTTITSSNGIKFTLDKDVTVASGSSDPTNLTAGTADVSVTAAAIGTDSNLPSNTKFTISGLSVLAAKNANAFSGGTKKSITVVSQKDLDNLTNQLIHNLKDKAKSDITAKANGDEVVLPDFTKTTAGITNFDKKVNDETQSINLDATITYETIVYKKSDIESYTKSALNGKLPSNLTLSENGITYDVKDMTTKDGTTKVTLTIKAALIPTLDTKSLTTQIAGKSFAQARDILSGVPQFSDAAFVLNPNLFFLPKTLPRLSGNITLTIVANE
ncbi:MAG TPA: baseplate J/gp47 family protein [Patescibacteria group bacterium]|nr:baseplate J/gp47 family protein [Patescibacteria group bacterium]